MIRKLTHMDRPMVSQEPQPDSIQKPAVPTSPQLGIAGTADGFEKMNPLLTDYANFAVQQQFGSGVPQTVSTRETVDASSMFDLIAETQQLLSDLDTHFKKLYTRSGMDIGGEKVNLNANVQANSHVGIKTTDTNITLASNENLKLGESELEGAHASLSGTVGPELMSLQSISSDIVDGAGDVVDWVTDLPSDLYDAAVVGSNDFFNAMFDAGEAIGDAGEAIGDAGKDVGEFFDGTVIGDGASWLAGMGEDVYYGAGDAANDFFGAFSDAGEAIGDAANDTFVEDAFDTFGTAAVDVSNFLFNLVNDPGPTIDEAVEDTINTIEAIVEDTGNFFGDAIEATGEAAEDTGDFIVNAANTIGEGISDGVDAIGDAIDDWF